jgi:hypothetical protein
MRIGIVAPAAGLLVLFACGSAAPGGPAPAPSAPPASGTATPASPGPGGYEFATPATGIRKAELDLEVGANSLDVAGQPLSGRLYHAVLHLPAGLVPRVTDDRAGDVHRVRISAEGSGSGPATVAVGLDPPVAWLVDVSGGATRETLDLSTVRLVGLTQSGGGSEVSMMLPRPTGTLPVTLSGGVTRLTIVLPRDVPARAVVTGGVGRLDIDGTEHAGTVAQGTFDSDGYEPATDRVEIRLSGGASAVEIEHR